MGSQLIKELTYFLLEKDYQSNNSHTNQFVENASQQSHFKHLTDKEPHKHKHKNAHKDIKRTALFHQPVDVVEHQCDKKNVDKIL